MSTGTTIKGRIAVLLTAIGLMLALGGGLALAEVLIGTNGNDSLVGTELRDEIQGLGGDDQINGRAGNDRLEGGKNKDVIFGGRGNDALIGGPNDDKLAGALGDDRFFAVDGTRDVISCGLGTDTVRADQFDALINACENATIINVSEPAE